GVLAIFLDFPDPHISNTNTVALTFAPDGAPARLVDPEDGALIAQEVPLVATPDSEAQNPIGGAASTPKDGHLGPYRAASARTAPLVQHKLGGFADEVRMCAYSESDLWVDDPVVARALERAEQEPAGRKPLGRLPLDEAVRALER